LAIYIAKVQNKLILPKEKEFAEQILKLPREIEELLKECDKLNLLSKEFLNTKNMFFIGRGFDYPLAMEGALKLKEISYINAQSYAAGELKHGTISLIEEGTIVVALCTQKNLLSKMIANIKEVKARGATVVAIATRGSDEIVRVADKIVEVPDANEYFSGIFAIIYLQLFAYYVSYNKGLDVDKPRNLAKSVTVE
jgi:glucosamine--fructose-6-phosphate aminotransferase (isomerizing)